MKYLRIALPLTLLLTLSGCAIIKPYTIQVQQGDLLSTKQIKAIKPGMTQQQVSYLLGTPNVMNTYTPNTWCYVYTNQKDHQPRAEKKLFIEFKDGKVSEISGDYAPPSTLQYTTYQDQPKKP